MVGLADIPCVGKAVDKISDATVAAMFRGIRYMFLYKSLVDDLNSEIGKLNSEKDRISVKVKEERDNGKIIYDDVLTWQKDAEEIQKNAKEFSPWWRCIHCLPIPNPISRFRMGREAVRKAKAVTGLTGSGKEILAKDIAHLPPVENEPNNDAQFQSFQSRINAYVNLWQDLVNEDGPLILGIYGMPGVGKTRMMQQIWKQAVEKKIFDKVTLAVVGSEKLNVMDLQKQIASHLGCHLVSQDDKRHRANQLKNSLKNGGNILIILDDVWTEIPLEDVIGTSLGDGSISKGCKILFTSRKKDVCLDNNCENPVEITSLLDAEAWDFFTNTVGAGKINSLQDESLARKVCKKCAGLPLIIRAVGKALKPRTPNLWEDTLEKLENCKIESVGGITGEVYACLKLSFDNLEEDAKACLLLSSQFPEDANIYISKLILLATGSHLVSGGRTRVRAMVDILKSSSLVLQGRDDQHFKLHDIIRDVARSIAVKEYDFSFARCEWGLPDNNAHYGTRKLLQLDLEKNDFRFPDDLVCPDLHTLWLRSAKQLYTAQNQTRYIEKLSGGMFVNLRFLVLKGFSCRQQFFLQPLWTLKMLFLDQCDITETDASFFPEKLESLCIWDCRLPDPMDLPILKDLRKLEILGTMSTVLFMPNTISCLSSLEALHIPNGFIIKGDEFKIWDDKILKSTPIWDEISKLTRLTSLQIRFNKFELFQDKTIFSKLREFDIRTGLLKDPKPSTLTTRLIHLCGYQLEGFHSLIESAEDVRLSDCNTTEYLARIAHHEIQHSRLHPQTPFSKLTILDIESCSSMKYLFSNSIAKNLVLLQNLSITHCHAMEAVVMNEEGTNDGDIINFPKLKSLKIARLPRLKTFFGEEKDSSNIPHLQVQPLFDGMVAFPSLVELELYCLEHPCDIWGKHYYNDENLSSSFSKLKSLYVFECNKLLETVIPLAMLHKLHNLESLKIRECSSLRNAFLPSIARDLIHLKTLEVIRCQMMSHIIGEGGQEITHDIVFPELTILRLFDLRNLTSFWCYQSGEANSYKVGFPNLVGFSLSCREINLEGLQFGRDDSTCQLKRLDISCDNQIELPDKWLPRLHNLEQLTVERCWWHELKSLCFRSLTYLSVHKSGCYTLFTPSGFTSLEKLQHFEISDCALLEEIVEDVRGDEPSGTDNNIFILHRLKSLNLVDLPNLKSYFHGANHEWHMPALETVKVNNCGLSTVFKCSAFRTLQQLRDLSVYNCKLLEEIVEGVGGDETLDTNGEIIALPQLIKVDLFNLPKLRGFSPTKSYAFNMPKLKDLHLRKCPQVEYFTFKTTSTGLVSVFTEWHKGEKVPDLNDYIRQNRKKGIHLSHGGGETSNNNQELGTESEKVEDEEQLHEDEVS